MTSFDPYLLGLRLDGRRVVVIGAGRVAERRLQRLLEAGARVEVIAPEATLGIRQLHRQQQLHWTERDYRPGDLDGAWYVLAATDDADCNQRVSAAAEQLRVFCVRADDRHRSTAWTPASGTTGGIQVGVLAGGDHGRSRRVRDLLLRSLITIVAQEKTGGRRRHRQGRAA